MINWIRYRRGSFATSARSVVIAHPGKSWRQNPCSWKILGPRGKKSLTGLPAISVAAALMVPLPNRFLKRLRNIASEKFSLVNESIDGDGRRRGNRFFGNSSDRGSLSRNRQDPFRLSRQKSQLSAGHAGPGQGHLSSRRD